MDFVTVSWVATPHGLQLENRILQACGQEEVKPVMQPSISWRLLQGWGWGAASSGFCIWMPQLCCFPFSPVPDLCLPPFPPDFIFFIFIESVAPPWHLGAMSAVFLHLLLFSHKRLARWEGPPT